MKGWSFIKIRDYPIQIIDGDRGTNYPTKEEFLQDGYCLFLNTGNVTLSGFNFDKNAFITEEKHKKLRKGHLQRYDSVLTTRGTIGNVAFYGDSISYDVVRINSGMLILRPDQSKLDPRFFYGLLRSSIFQQQAELFRYGAAQPQLPITTLKHIKLPLPQLPIQQKIAGILAAYDDLIENNLKRIKLLEEKAQITYEEWFVHLRFPGHESTPINPKTSLPIGWERARLQDLLVLQRGFDLPTKDRIEGAVPVYASTGVTGFHNQVKVKAPGVMTGRSGTLGHVMYSNIDFWPLNTTLWVKEFKGISPIFAYYLLKSLNFENYNSGVAVPTLNRNDVHLVHVLKPEERIVDLFTDNLNPIFVLLDKLKDQNQRLREARDILLPRLMTGVIDVENYDPAQLLKEAS